MCSSVVPGVGVKRERAASAVSSNFRALAAETAAVGGFGLLCLVGRVRAKGARRLYCIGNRTRFAWSAK